jgi:hypothetical protein
MPALRFLSGLLLLIAVVVLVADITNARGPLSSGLTVSMAKHWSTLAPSSLAASQKSAQAVSPILWDPILKSFLAIPAWSLFALLGSLFAYIGRRRRRVNIYTN